MSIHVLRFLMIIERTMFLLQAERENTLFRKFEGEDFCQRLCAVKFLTQFELSTNTQISRCFPSIHYPVRSFLKAIHSTPMKCGYFGTMFL